MYRNAILTLFSVIALNAQTPPAAQSPSPQPAPGLSPAPAGPLQRRMTIDPASADRMIPDMTPEQKTQMEAASAAYREKAGPLETRLRTLRLELDQKINGETLDEAGVRAKAQEIAGVEVELAIAKAHRIAKLREFLNAEQIKRFLLVSPAIDRRFQMPLQSNSGPTSGPGPRSIPARPQIQPQAPAQPPSDPK